MPELNYEYYKNVYYGDVLSRNEFSRYSFKACSLIERETVSRISFNSINKCNFPEELKESARRCACDLSEVLFYFDYLFYSGSDLNNRGNDFGIERNNREIVSEKAGEVSVTYATKESSRLAILKKITDEKQRKLYIKSLIESYLYPREINGIFWNVLSKRISNKCNCCC